MTGIKTVSFGFACIHIQPPNPIIKAYRQRKTRTVHHIKSRTQSNVVGLASFSKPSLDFLFNDRAKSAVARIVDPTNQTWNDMVMRFARPALLRRR
jgi:hypothetical protein